MKVLIATDGSHCSDHALTEAVRLLPLETAEVHVVAVADTISPMMAYEGAGAAMPLVLDRQIADTRLARDKAVAALASHAIKATGVVLEGLAAESIVHHARELGADVIVVGSHGRNALGRMILGSVSTYVLHHFKGAVLVVRTD